MNIKNGLLVVLLIICTMMGTVMCEDRKREKELKKQVDMAEMNKILEAQQREEQRTHIYDLIDVNCSSYRIKNMGLGGISGAQVSVLSHSDYVIDLLIVEVQYLTQSGNLYKTEKLTFRDVKPNVLLHQYAPDSRRGTQLKCGIADLKCKELDL